jgi:hypothetical protein
MGGLIPISWDFLWGIWIGFMLGLLTATILTSTKRRERKYERMENEIRADRTGNDWK